MALEKGGDKIIPKYENYMNDSDLVLTVTNNVVNENCDNKIPWRSALRQIAACCVAHSLVIHAGINMAFSAILLPQLQEGGDIHISKEQASWIASVVAIALPLGALVIGPLMDRFGRKNMCIVATFPFIVTWIMHACARHVWHLYVARVMAGFGGGLTTVGLVYVSEITHPDYRTMLLSLNSVLVSFGILLTCLLGLWFNWRVMALVNLGMILTSLGMLCLIPESPNWHLVFRNDRNMAARSLRWLYKNDDQVFKRQFQTFLETTTTRPETIGDESRSSLGHVYRQPEVLKPSLILIAIFVIQQLSCAYVIIFYAVYIFRKVGGRFEKGLLDEYVALVGLGVIRFAMSILSALLSKRVGRRPLFFVSGLGMCVTSLTAGLYLYINVIPHSELAKLSIEKDKSDSNIPLYCVLGYVCFSSLGYLVIPWTLIGELLPVKVRGKIGGFMVSFAYVVMFGAVKAFPFVLDSLSIESLFYVLAIVNLIGVIFIFFFLPETLGRSFREIEGYFKSD